MQANKSSGFVRNNTVFAMLAVVSVSICLSLIIVEFALRSIVSMDPRSPAEFRIPHPVLGWVLEPGASYLCEMPEAKVSVQKWRDLEYKVKKPEGTIRILVLGDSFIEAYSVELKDAFHRRVEDLVRATGRNVEVINMGVAGYGTLQEYLTFEEFGRLYEPDIVLLGFFALNDLIDNSYELSSILKQEGVTTIARPFLDSKESTQWSVTLGDYEEAKRLYSENQALLDAQRHALTEQVILLHLASSAIMRITGLGFLKDRISEPGPIEKEYQDMALMGVNYCVAPPEYSRAWDITERKLAGLKTDVEKGSGMLVVFSVPAMEEVSVVVSKKALADISHPEKVCLEHAPGQTHLGIILAKLNVEFITLLPDLRRVMRENGVQLYRDSDRHWKPDGHF